jgi:hypothetical protein
MTKLHAGIGILLAGFIVLTLCAQDTTTRKNPTVVVGTFDSRAVATAYIRSDAFGDYLLAQKKDVTSALTRAEAAGDDEFVAALGALGPAMQKRFHEQGFGTAPVDDIIARISAKLPALAKEADVDVIVSKWTLVYHDPAAKFVDVTELLAAEFNPDKATWKIIRSFVAIEPIRLDELDH